MAAHEALIAGVLGLAALYSWQRRRDPVDRWLALGALWICVTGIISLLIATLDDPARYIRLAIRLTGPPILLVICEESVRTRTAPGSRTTSLAFATAVWLAAVIAMVYYNGGVLGGANVTIPILGPEISFGITAWMAILAVSFLAALLTIIPAALKRVNPGSAGLAAMLLLFSEAWAAVDPRWGAGSIEIGAVISYRSLLTFVLAGVALLKAHQPGWTWLRSAAATDPIEPDISKRKSGRAVGARSEAGSAKEKEKKSGKERDEDEAATRDSEEPKKAEKSRSSKSAAAIPSKSGKKKSKGKKKKKK